jgi:hypothetical protein
LKYKFLFWIAGRLPLSNALALYPASQVQIEAVATPRVVPRDELVTRYISIGVVGLEEIKKWK